MLHHFTIRHGYRVELAGQPLQKIGDAPTVRGAAILGRDLGGIRANLSVAPGDKVRAGQPLFTDRARPAITHVSPVSGTVEGIDHGPRRSLSALRLTIDPDADGHDQIAAPGDTGEALRETLLARGLWPSFRARPFGHVPDPDAVPAAIFVTAMDTQPLAPDPAVVLEPLSDAFQTGVAALTRLTNGPVYVCQAPGPELAPNITGAQTAVFEGGHPAGLAGTHIHRLRPATPDHPVWTIGYQDVAAIGTLLSTGVYPTERVVSLAGSRVANPRLVRTVPGARLRDLAEGQLLPSPEGMGARLIAGSAISGHEAAYLGRYCVQVTALDAPAENPARGVLGWLLRARGAAARLPIIPMDSMEHALPFAIPAVPLLRALASGDADAARRLGALELVEEDVALLSALCLSRSDYGALLRRVLDILAEPA